ncbi:MAG: hypothetical protein ABL879_15460 [Devosia sp.]
MGGSGFLMALLGGLAGGVLLSSLFGQGGQQQPQAPAPTLQPQQAAPAAQAPNATATPDYNSLVKANTKASRSGPSAGPSSTFKSGAGGIDPSQLSLGTNTLLGA